MLFNRAVYSLTREMYVAGCELHIQTPTLLIVLTLKTICQRQNHLSGLFYDRVCNLSLVCSLQSAFYPQSVLYPRSAVCSLNSVVYVLH